MTKYLSLNLKRSEFPTIINDDSTLIFDDNYPNEKISYVCETCFRILKTQDNNHLEKCNLSYPDYSSLCYEDNGNKIKIFELIDEKGYTRKIMNCIERMAFFSKLEQEIDLRITKRHLVGRGFSCYILFCYKTIISYCLVQEYKEGENVIHLILRDIYTSPRFRRNKNSYASLLLKIIAKQYGLPLESFLFSAPVSDKLKLVLKKIGLEYITTIQGENFKTIENISLKNI